VFFWPSVCAQSSPLGVVQQAAKGFSIPLCKYILSYIKNKIFKNLIIHLYDKVCPGA
jgi:hypothetical protein